MSLKRALAPALILCLVVPFVACDDVNTVEKPTPPKQITTEAVFVKAVDDDDNQIGLQSNDVFSLLVPSTGDLWVGNQAGIAVFANGAPGARSAGYNETNGLPNPKVRSLAELNGKVYVATWGGGVGVYDIAGDTWSAMRASATGLVQDEVSAIRVHNDKVYVSTLGGAGEYDPATDTWRRYIKDTRASVIGDLLDEYVSTLEVADTPRGTEYWFCPRWETGIDEGKEGDHGITVTRDFNATRVTLRLQASKDNTIYEDPNGELSNGAGTKFFSGVSVGGKIRAGLIQFDLSSSGIPAGATILSATLRMNVVTGSANRGEVHLYRATSDWGEGTSVAAGDETAGAFPTAGDATWLHSFYPNTFWLLPGGDRSLETSGSIFVDTPKRYAWSKPGMVADLNYWLRNPSKNFGWAVVNSGELKQFASREYGTATSRPELEISYSVFTYYTVLNSDLPEPNINDIMYDQATDLFWLSTSNMGLTSVDVGNKKWTRYTIENGLPSNVVYSTALVGGTLWVGTQDGVARYVGNGMFQGYKRGGGLQADRVRRVYSDDGTRLWLGFIDGGAARVDPTTAQ